MDIEHVVAKKMRFTLGIKLNAFVAGWWNIQGNALIKTRLKETPILHESSFYDDLALLKTASRPWCFIIWGVWLGSICYKYQVDLSLSWWLDFITDYLFLAWTLFVARETRSTWEGWSVRSKQARLGWKPQMMATWKVNIQLHCNFLLFCHKEKSGNP